MLVFETGLLTGPRYIVNFPTKRHWKGKSRIEDIDAGLPALVEEIRNPVNFKIYEAACKRHEVPPRKDAGLRNGSPDRASIHRQFPDEASLEGQEPHRGYRRWTAGAC